MASWRLTVCCLLDRQTQVPQEVFQEYLAELGTVFTPEAYSLFDNNCNNFCDEVASFLTGTSIPVGLPPLPLTLLPSKSDKCPANSSPIDCS